MAGRSVERYRVAYEPTSIPEKRGRYCERERLWSASERLARTARFSQLDLALAARTTQRHLSFIESGRATPSRAMILRLAATMSLPLRQQNALMLAAGYAPAWRERDLSAPDLAVV